MKKIPFILTGLALLASLCGCSDNNGCSDDGAIGKGKEVILTLGLRVPGINHPVTYALSEQDEHELKEIDILVFKKSASAETFLYHTHATGIDNHSGSVNKTFRAQLQKSTGSDEHRIVLIANARDAVDAVKEGFTVGMDKDAVLGEITFATFTLLPMWGQTEGTHVITASTTASTLKTINLMRSVARIDVGLNMDSSDQPQGLSTFKMKTVMVCNANNLSAVAPLGANLTDGKATLPTLVSSETSDITYTQDAEGNGFIREIYVGEADNKKQTDDNKMMCLVVGGYYTKEGEPENMWTQTWYRIDFYKKKSPTDIEESNPQERLDILRNHRYRVNITSVDGPGYSKPDEALGSRPVNMETSIFEWNDADITEVTYDGQYMLGVSIGEFSFTREARTSESDDNALWITTTHPDGWKLDKIVYDPENGMRTVTDDSPDWLKLAHADGSIISTGINTGNAGATTAVKLLLDENTTDESRTGNIYLSAGRLTYIVEVIQSAASADLGLSIKDVTTGNEISELAFIASANDQPAVQHFTLNWTPASSDIFFSNTAIGNAFVFDTGSNQDDIANGIITSGGGIKKYTIQPTAISSDFLLDGDFYERTSVVLFTVSNGTSSVSKTLTLRQSVYNTSVVADRFYLMDGTRKSFRVRSNTPFTVEVKNNPDGVIIDSKLTTSGAANTNTSGTPVYFDMIDDLTDLSLVQRDVVVTVKSPQNLFAAIDVKLSCVAAVVQEKSNSYIVAPNGVGILIPVGRCNESILDIQLGSSDTDIFTAELVWTDNPKGVAADSNIKMIRAIGVGATGYILVMPGSVAGNAVVAIKNTSNTILWSWHIWVTDYSPEPSPFGFMDRNLGAIGNEYGAVGIKGLLYQWGRKDPFPNSTTINGDIEPGLYTATGSVIYGGVDKSSYLLQSNFVNSVENPFTFYFLPKGQDWFGSAKNDDLWGYGSTKTVYDPCPPGWRVPSPNGTISPWNELAPDDGSFDWSSVGLGRISATHGGFYPAAGYRSDKGALGGMGLRGFYWTAMTSSADRYAYNLYFSGYIPDFTLFEKTSRACGLSVRCVQVK